jgi:hypothetical protein
MLRKRFQLGLIHLAVAMTLVPINSTLNRVMIKELGIAATVVAILASLPYLFSPLQVAIGSYSAYTVYFSRSAAVCGRAGSVTANRLFDGQQPDYRLAGSRAGFRRLGHGL